MNAIEEAHQGLQIPAQPIPINKKVLSFSLKYLLAIIKPIVTCITTKITVT
jgi:hypothetical protein